MKIFHEVPVSLLEQSHKFNDGDYALVHLLEESTEYHHFFVESLKKGRHVILDNSIFELGEAFDSDRYAEWIKKLRPTEYIIPDALEDCIKTMDNALVWKEKYSDLPGRKIGVVQGKSYSDLIHCYQYLDEVIDVDKIAISFDYSYYLEVAPHPNKWMGYVIGRIQTLTRLMADGIINKNKPHHLLGCALPIEMFFYREGFDWIESMDTSSPVVHGLLDIVYEPGGIISKQSIKLADLIQSIPTPEQVDKINWNLSIFRSYCNGMVE